MSRKKMGGGGHEEGGAHGDRPWVYFMIDSFFLVTQFFVITFRVRTGDDLILPHRLPPGSGGKPVPTITDVPKTAVAITVNRDNAQTAPWYKINGGELLDTDGITTKLSQLAEGRNPDTFSVRISYEGKVIFRDVMPIFNTCMKLKIKECGLQRSRGGATN